MTDHPVATEDEWLAARREMLAEEKEFTRLRDALARKRRAMPWLPIGKDYRFDGPEGPNLALGDLFGGKRQLVVYHFMFAPDWETPCKSCSFWADGYNGVTAHLGARHPTRRGLARSPRKARGDRQAHGLDLPVVFVGRGRLQLRLPRLVPSGRPDGGAGPLQFRADRDEDDRPAGNQRLHPGAGRRDVSELSAYARGLDMLNPAYQLLDITPSAARRRTCRSR